MTTSRYSHPRTGATMKRFLPFHERHPTLHEAAIAVGLVLFLGFGFGWDYAFAGIVLLALLYVTSAAILWARTLRKHGSRNNR
jgi:hypothetical protein